MRRTALLFCGLALLAPAPLSGEEDPEKQPLPSTYEEAAAAVRKAIEAGDDDVLKGPVLEPFDPWIVADHLRVDGRLADALHYARVVARPATAKLVAYLESLRTAKVDPTAHARLIEAVGALQRGEVDKALERAGAAPPADVATIRLAYVRAHVHKHRRAFQQGLAEANAAGRAAARIGWSAYEGKLAFWSGLERLDRGDYEDAARDFARSLAAYRRAEMRSAANDVLGGLGVATKNLGRYLEALEIYERGLAASRELKDRKGEANALNNIGIIHERLGSHAKALDFYHRSLVIERALDRKDGISSSLTNMANVYCDLGDYAKALSLFEEALRLDEAGGDRQSIPLTLNNMAGAYRLLGRPHDARKAYDRALAIHREREDWNGMATVHLNVGHLLHEDGSLDDEISHYERALEILRAHPDAAMQVNLHSSLGRAREAQGRGADALVQYDLAEKGAQALGDRASVAQIGFSRGMLALDAGRLDEAEREMRAAAEALGELGRREWEVRSVLGLARVSLARGRYPLAVEQARQAIELAGPLLGGLADEEAASARQRRARFFEVGVRAAVGAGSPGDALFFLEHGRAGALAEALRARSTLREVLTPDDLREEDARAHDRVDRAQRALARAQARGKLRAVRARRLELDAARDALNAVARRMQRQAKAGVDITHPRPVALDALQARLRPQDAFVLYSLAAEDAHALVVRKKTASLHPLGPAGEIDALAKQAAFGDAGTDASAVIEPLRARILTPLRLGEDVTRLLVSPDGALAYVPFCALDRKREIAFAPSGTTLSLLGERRPTGSRAVLAVGDPDYRTHAPAGAGRARGLTALPATRAEVEAIGTRVLLGKDASESAFAEAVASASWRAIHLACHGLVDTDRPMFSSVALSRTADSDGLLTVLEVFRMQVRSDLVVLSACETARGKLYKAEGIVGLTRAFMFAGAPRVLCSLWKVDDEATRALMIRFYELWSPKDGSKGRDAAGALKEAQAFVRGHEKWKHPYYWAAWVLWGLAE